MVSLYYSCWLTNIYTTIDIEDVDTYMPGYLKSTDTFFRVYKLPSGKKENDLAFDGEAKNKVRTSSDVY